jgi:transposase
VAAPEEMSREELIAVVRRQDGQITTLSTQVADLLGVNEKLAVKLARLEHLLSRNSGNSSMPPSKDDDPGRTPPPEKPKRPAGPTRKRGKQPCAPGTNLAWVERPDDQRDRFPQGPSAAMIWPRRWIWGSWIAISSTRSRRSV